MDYVKGNAGRAYEFSGFKEELDMFGPKKFLDVPHPRYKSNGGSLSEQQLDTILIIVPNPMEIREAGLDVVREYLSPFDLNANRLYANLHVMFPKADVQWKLWETRRILSSAERA
jgi:hypothetical protein